MAICRRCNREMLAGVSCVATPGAIPNGNEQYWREGPDLDGTSIEPARCHDCGVDVGGFHHQHCDMAECPVCHGQLLSCDLDGEHRADVLG